MQSPLTPLSSQIAIATALLLLSFFSGAGSLTHAEENADRLPPVAPAIQRQQDVMPQEAPAFSEMSSTRIRIKTQQTNETSPEYGRFDSRPRQASADQNNLTGSAQIDQGRDNGRGLTKVELNRLAQRDVVLIIDQSSSMLTHDCPGRGFGSTGGDSLFGGILGRGLPLGGAVSRWQWCTAQTAELSQQTAQIFNKGITVVMFSSGFEIFPHVTLKQVPELFSRNRPMGGTNLAPALASQIGAYFKRRAEFRGNVKPVVIGIVTDGCPNNRQSVKQAIIEATHMMRNPREIAIIFFLIGGMDYQGERFVAGLESNLTRQGAAFPIVKGIRFDELRQAGLAKALAQSLQ